LGAKKVSQGKLYTVDHLQSSKQTNRQILNDAIIGKNRRKS